MSARLDKFLWSARIFKTRLLATEACKKGWITVNDMPVKPSRSIVPGEIIKVRKMPVIYHYRVLKLIDNRVGAKLVPEILEDITPAEELEKLKLQDSFYVKRDRGSGRPTKKERRDIDDFFNN